MLKKEHDLLNIRILVKKIFHIPNHYIFLYLAKIANDSKRISTLR
ncbi:hypothetical protein FEM08_10080 [Flavobacterium gilvum]|nr:hypothetical protein FEM08_10080 [Flavobacterium gilvum]